MAIHFLQLVMLKEMALLQNKDLILLLMSLNNSEVVAVVIELPIEYALGQNYPNPFNPSTKIKYSVPQSGLVTIAVYDLTGQEVARLVNEVKEAGNFEVDFNAVGLSSGVYFYKMISNNFSQVKKMSILK